MTIRLGLQIPNFTYPDTPPQDIFGKVVAQAQAAERAGFDTVMVMDHFYQLPGIGPAENEMLEAYTALAALAMATEQVQLSALVTGNTYRNPALLAKTVTSLDVVSRGRAILGIGAGWFEHEHIGYGFDFGTSASGSRSWTRRCRSSGRCCAGRPRPSRVATTAPTRRSTTRASARTCRS